jgi:hypothetical protein
MRRFAIIIGILQCLYYSKSYSLPVIEIHTDTTVKWAISGYAGISNRGLAPVPGANFTTPVMTAGMSLHVNRLSYEPDFSIGLNGKPWMANNYIRYHLRDKRKTSVTVGINPFFFFAQVTDLSGKMVIAPQKTLNFELAGLMKISERCILSFSYNYSKGFDRWCLDGNSYAIGSSITGLVVWRNFSVCLDNQLFYLDLSNHTNGIFGAAKINLKHRRSPLYVDLQGLIALRTCYAIERIQWSAGLGMRF